MSIRYPNISWKEVLIPLFSDLQQINQETDTRLVANNNLELAQNEEKFKVVLEQITKQKASSAEEVTPSE